MEIITYPEDIKKQLIIIIQKHINRFETNFGIDIALRGNRIMFDGEEKNRHNFKKCVEHLIDMARKNMPLDENSIALAMEVSENGNTVEIDDIIKDRAIIKVNGKDVYPKTVNQNRYIQSMNCNDLVFAIGPAGTGKTFLAIAMALHHLLNRKVERIVLTRPVVEAGEKLGFLPGDIQQKVNPYFRPLYDSLYHLIGFERTSELIDKNIIEIAPLAYMRGRTINNAFIILDEGQNTTVSQMKMFLTRFGSHSKVIITADTSQIDLPPSQKSGIFQPLKILKGIQGIAFSRLYGKDVVRHNLVQKIINAYEKNAEKKEEK